MRSEEVQLGGTYHAKVGGALRRVTIKWAREGSLTLAGRRRPTRYGCLTLDTGRIIQRTAAALRALPGTPESAAAQAREAARRARPRRTKPDMPADSPRVSIDASGMLKSDALRSIVARAVGRIHVGDMPGRVLRVARGLWRFRWLSMPRDMRRAIMLTALAEHRANGLEYEAVTRQPVPPSYSTLAALIMREAGAVARKRAEDESSIRAQALAEAERQERRAEGNPCPACGGPAVPLGRLGDADWNRCRDCGTDYCATMRRGV